MKSSTQEPVATPDTNRPETSQAPHFDKLRVMKTLQAATFSEDQAGAMVEAIDDAQRHLATKSDMKKMEYVLRTDMEKMESGIRTDMQKMESGIRADMQKMESGIRADMGKMESGIRADMGKMELRLQGEIKDLRADMQAEFKRLYWYIPLVIGVAASLLGVFSPS